MEQSFITSGPGLGPNCLQGLSANGKSTSKQRVKVDMVFGKVNFVNQILESSNKMPLDFCCT